MDQDGNVHRNFEVRETTGEVRVRIASPGVRNDPTKLMDTVLEACLVSVGPVTKIDSSVVRKLLIPDRDFLFFAIRCVSEPDEPLRGEMMCRNPMCGEKISLVIPTNEIAVTYLEDGQCETDAETHSRFFHVKNEQLGVDAEFKYPDGDDQAAISKLMGRNPIEANYTMFARCLRRWGDKRPPFSPAFFRQMGTRQLNVIDRKFQRDMPGVETQHEVECASCQQVMPIQLNVTDFLLKGPERPTG
jgi:hypothetical protein